MEGQRLAGRPAATLDDVLTGICQALQLGQEAHERIEKSYRAVGEWLSADDSPLAVYRPQVYPQGSVAMGLTVRPIGGGEYDVDAVLLLDTQEADFRRLYDLVWNRLASNLTYRDKLERLDRCIRIDYAGDFHLDVIPACPNPVRGGTHILIPDRELRGYRESNPKGFIAWFDARAGLFHAAKHAEPEPLPAPETAAEKSALHRVVQLMKRRRDVIFEKRPDDAPASILVTCLAGQAYQGETSVVETMERVLEWTTSRADEHDGPFPVENPSNPGENLAECWQSDHSRYEEFLSYVSKMGGELQELSSLHGTALTERLRELYGESPVDEAYRQIGLRVQKARTKSHLGASSSGLIVGSSRGNPRHTFFGDDET